MSNPVEWAEYMRVREERDVVTQQLAVAVSLLRALVDEDSEDPAWATRREARRFLDRFKQPAAR